MGDDGRADERAVERGGYGGWRGQVRADARERVLRARARACGDIEPPIWEGADAHGRRRGVRGRVFGLEGDRALVDVAREAACGERRPGRGSGRDGGGGLVPEDDE